ncbi:MAG: hypothetical protein AB1404_00760, partial [Spirochaetota bacterium]
EKREAGITKRNRKPQIPATFINPEPLHIFIVSDILGQYDKAVPGKDKTPLPTWYFSPIMGPAERDGAAFVAAIRTSLE